MGIVNVLILIFLATNGGWCKITDRQYASIPPVFELGDFDRCMMLDDEALYCFFTFQLYPEHENTTSETWNIIKELSDSPKNYRHDQLRHGICLPLDCPNATKYLSTDDPQVVEEITRCYNQMYQPMGLKGEVTKINCQTKESPYPVDLYDIAYAFVVLSYLAFVIFASFFEGTARYKSNEEYEKITGTRFGRIVSAFSLPKNWDRLKTVNLDNPDVRNLRCIQGIRFYNMLLVILTHTVMVNLAAPIKNTRYTETMTDKFLNIFLANGGYAVQTFFMISGWLLTHQFLTTFENKKDLKPVHLLMAFVHRYIRLTPTLALVIGFHSTWLVHMSRGPFWDNIVGDEYRNCRSNWWTNMLYVNNYVNKYNMCVQPTWYLAVDTQLFIFALILVGLILKYPNHVMTILGITMVIGLIVPMVASFVNNYDILVRSYPEPVYNLFFLTPEWHGMFTSAYTNTTGYTVGIIFGYIYFKQKDKSFTVSRYHVAAYWILGFGLSHFVVLIAARMYKENYTFTRFEAAIYWGFGRAVFAFCIAILVFGMSRKIGSATRWVCEWYPTTILGRLTFTAYLVHLALIKIRLGVIRSPNFASNEIFFQSALGECLLVYLVSVVLCLSVEMPVSALQKMVTTKTPAANLPPSVALNN